jgi:replicative DNA helicase
MALADDRPAGRPRPVRVPNEGVDPNGTFDRQPPQDLTAEQSVLGGMLLSKDAIADVVEILRPDDFYRPASTAAVSPPTPSPSPPSCSVAAS